MAVLCPVSAGGTDREELLSKAKDPFFFFFEGVVFFTTEPLEDFVYTLVFSEEETADALE